MFGKRTNKVVKRPRPSKMPLGRAVNEEPERSLLFTREMSEGVKEIENTERITQIIPRIVLMEGP